LEQPQDVLPLEQQPVDFKAKVLCRLDSLCRLPLMETTQLGLMVYDLTSDSVVYSVGARQRLRPASTMKLLTAITALDLLDSDYWLRTTLSRTGDVSNGVLTGDLILSGGMDPHFSDVDLEALVEGLEYLEIDTVRGRLVADRSFKEEELLGEGWCWDDDNPVLSPLIHNRKDILAEQLLQRIREKGIVVEGGLTTGRGGRSAITVSTRGRSLDVVLRQMLKESDNLYAEAVFYQIAAATGARPAKASQARAAVRRLINRLGLNPQRYRIADGSGLSLYNYVTPELLVMMLRYAWQQEHIIDRLYTALPIAGEDGTLKSRMEGKYTAGNVHAKTGTLTGISSLAGYCTAPNGHELAFCIINQGVERAADGKAFQDAVCTALCTP
jgi:D-alanyl-D-alanine carboxypeptidase/D-alanyl-D-alanine-endopeptidase (penicillin-binding protein 4)